MNFFDTTHCRSRFHCRTCRDRKGIEQLRKQMEAQGEKFPEDFFECPAGLPWLSPETADQFADAHKAVPAAKALPSLAVQRIEAHCKKCENFQERRCLLYRDGRCSPCEFAAYLNRPGAICPGGQAFS